MLAPKQYHWAKAFEVELRAWGRKILYQAFQGLLVLSSYINICVPRFLRSACRSSELGSFQRAATAWDKEAIFCYLKSYESCELIFQRVCTQQLSLPGVGMPCRGNQCQGTSELTQRHERDRKSNRVNLPALSGFLPRCDIQDHLFKGEFKSSSLPKPS